MRIYLVAAAIGLLLLFLLKPMIDNQKEMKKYDFSVTSVDGEIKKEDFKGKVLAVYFGYMFCPDVCPTSLSTLAYSLEGFSQKELEEFRGLFISVDPDRDTLKDLDEYAKYFHKRFIGATSDKENLDDITKRYESYYEKVYLEDSKMDYSVAHTSFIYIFDRDGRFVKKIDHFTNPNEIKEVLSKLL